MKPKPTKIQPGATHWNPYMLGGLTKREQIAAMAMQGILSNAYWNEHGAYRPKDVSEAAVEYADELLSALSAGKGGES